MLPPRRPAPDALSDSRLQDGLDCWGGKLAGRSMAARADIDPVEIPSLLQHLMLVDVVANGRFRYRLIGTGERRGTGAPRQWALPR